jgi:transcription termination factor NusG
MSLLEFQSYDCFLPTYSRGRLWSHRVKRLEVPLFPGYVFSRFALSERIPIIKSQGSLESSASALYLRRLMKKRSLASSVSSNRASACRRTRFCNWGQDQQGVSCGRGRNHRGCLEARSVDRVHQFVATIRRRQDRQRMGSSTARLCRKEGSRSFCM